MAKGVGRDVLSDAGKTGVFGNNAFNRAWGKAAKIAGSVRNILITGIIKKQSGKRIGADV